ncbi:MAG: DnaJ domain-containing protein, partial [Rhabdochlamydiaceae bacterium]
LLNQIKAANLTKGGPSSSFIAIKQSILNANNAYEVLGLKTGASKQECKKAYAKNAIHIHPDKAPEIWWEQASELFKIMDAAYRSLTSV